MVGKVVISLVSLILVVGAVISAVVVLHKGGDNNTTKAATVSTSSKTVTSICANTQYQDACMNSLGNVAKNESATPKDYIVAAIQATIEEAGKSFKVAQSVKTDGAKNPGQDLAVEDCKQQLQFAIDDLQAAFSMVGDSELHTINDRIFELLNWFTAVVSYQQSCLDQLEAPEYRSVIENGMVNATQLTSNAINIVAKITEVFQAFNINLDAMLNPQNTTAAATTGNRRLLEVTEVGHDGYPTWFSAADRKLLAANNQNGMTPNAVVAKDGSGQYKTVGAAVAAIPQKKQGRWVIYVKAGIYNEIVLVPKAATNVLMYGDGPTTTIISGSMNCGIAKTPTMQTATFSVLGAGFIAKNMGFRNTIGPKGLQAVAFRSQSDLSAYFNCRFEGYQDTLYYQSNRQFYQNCYISGTIDFIFGRGTALIQNSQLVIRMPLPNQQNTVTADGNHVANSIAGLVLQNCTIMPEPQLFPNRLTILSYLGRPWDLYSTTAVIQSEIGDVIQPVGWMSWANSNNQDTAIVAEYANRGAGAATNRRVRWKNFRAITNPADAVQYTAAVHLEGGSQGTKWVLGTGVAANMGLTQ